MKISKENLIISIFIVLKIILHLSLNLNSGLDGDEVLHIESGRHPAWGFMSIQPMIGLLAWIQNLLNSNSVFVHHLFSNLTGILIIILCASIVKKLGGGWLSIVVALICMIAAPGINYSQHLFTPLVFEQLFWLLSFYSLINFCIENKPKYLILLSIFLALGFMTKISILIFIFSIGVSILVYRRDLLKNKYLWLSVLVFLLIISPNLIWQHQNNYPLLFHMFALHGKVLVNIDIIDNLKLLFITTNPLTIFVWITAIFAAPFIPILKEYRFGILPILISFLVLFIFRGQFHYYYPTIIISFCIGGVVIEHIFKSKAVFIWIYISIVLIASVHFSPRVLPLLPLENYIDLLNLRANEKEQLFFTQQSISDNKLDHEDSRIPINFEAYYTKKDWIKLTYLLDSIYHQLPFKKRENCFIWARNYTQAGALNLYGKTHELPQAFSVHGNCYKWIPEFDQNATIILLANAEKPADSTGIASFYDPAFEKVLWKDAIFCPYARTSSNAYYMIYMGENLKYNSRELKERYKEFIFE